MAYVKPFADKVNNITKITCPLSVSVLSGASQDNQGTSMLCLAGGWKGGLLAIGIFKDKKIDYAFVRYNYLFLKDLQAHQHPLP